MEIVRLQGQLVPRSVQALAGDKASFAAFCVAQALPHAETVGHWRNGHAIVPPTSLPEQLVLKPTHGSNAAGVEIWVLSENTYQRAGGNGALNPAALVERAQAASAVWGGALIQPRLRLHPALAEAGLVGMPVVRVITAQVPHGAPEIIDSYISAPPAGQLASNAGYGPKWPIDRLQGTIESSQSRLLPAWHGESPLEGLTLPDWSAALDTVQRGHAMFPGRSLFLGWDVAFTPIGPVLLEVNTGIGLAVCQGARATPMGTGRAGEILDAWLEDSNAGSAQKSRSA